MAPGRGPSSDFRTEDSERANRMASKADAWAKVVFHNPQKGTRNMALSIPTVQKAYVLEAMLENVRFAQLIASGTFNLGEFSQLMVDRGGD